MSIEVEVQNRVDDDLSVPNSGEIERWAQSSALGCEGSVCIRIVSETEGRELNQTWRTRDSATNVLSFPVEKLPGIEQQPLGDIVICASIVAREALEQDKSINAHFAHMVIHGMLHLQGFDHLKNEEAVVMETREREIMTSLGFSDPYQESAIP